MNTLACNYKLYEPHIVSAENCVVTAANGKRYVDFESGVWCTALGHSHPRVVAALTRQLGRVAHVGYRYSADIVEEAAQKALRLFGFEGGRCVFLCAGSEAVELGVALARKITARPLCLCLKNYFLASYGSAAAQDAASWRALDLSAYDGDPDAFLASVPFGEIGAFVFEPGNASGAVHLPPPELIAAVGARVQAAGGLVVVDEVTAGTGRTGKWFGYQHYDLAPNIVAFGKGIGNGYPVSVVALDAAAAAAAERNGFRYAQSHQDDPLGCAVVSEVISVIEEEGLIAQSAARGARLRAGLCALRKTHPCIREVRGVGLMLAIELDAEESAMETLHRALFDAGYIVGVKPAARVLRFYPPLTISEEQIDGLLDALDRVLPTAASV